MDFSAQISSPHTQSEVYNSVTTSMEEKAKIKALKSFTAKSSECMKVFLVQYAKCERKFTTNNPEVVKTAATVFDDIVKLSIANFTEVIQKVIPNNSKFIKSWIMQYCEDVTTGASQYFEVIRDTAPLYAEIIKDDGANYIEIIEAASRQYIEVINTNVLQYPEVIKDIVAQFVEVIKIDTASFIAVVKNIITYHPEISNDVTEQQTLPVQENIGDSNPYLIGTENEAAKCIIFSNSRVYKGDVFAYTKKSYRHGYPLVSITADRVRGKDPKTGIRINQPDTEIVTAPIPLEEYKQNKMGLFIYILQTMIEQQVLNGGGDLREVVHTVNMLVLIMGGSPDFLMTCMYNDTVLKKNGNPNKNIPLTAILSGSEQEKIPEGAVHIARNVAAIGDLIWCPQLSFNVCYDNLIYLNLISHNLADINYSWNWTMNVNVNDIESSFSEQSLISAKIISELIDKASFNKLNEHQKNYLSIFIVRLSNLFSAYKKHLSRSLLPYIHTNNSIRFQTCCPRISMYQEIFEIWNSDDIQVWKYIFTNNTPDEIAEIFLRILNDSAYNNQNPVNIKAEKREKICLKSTLNEIRQLKKKKSKEMECEQEKSPNDEHLEKIKKAAVEEIIIRFITGNFRDLHECIVLHEEVGPKTVQHIATDSPYIEHNGEKRFLPTYAGDATSLIINKDRQSCFVMEVKFFDEKPWCVIEWRDMSASDLFLTYGIDHAYLNPFLLYLFTSFWGDKAETILPALYGEKIKQMACYLNENNKLYKKTLEEKIHSCMDAKYDK